MSTNYTFLLCLLLTAAGQGAAQPAIEPIKARVTQDLLAGAVDDAETATLLATIRDDGTWPGIDYRDVSRTGFEHRYHLSHLVALARAYRSPASRFHQKEAVLRAVESALSYWVDHDFICDNWWHNEIGTPSRLVALLLLLGADLDPALVQRAQPIIRRAHLEAPGARPGGDRIKIAGIQAKNALFLGDTALFRRTIAVIEGEIKHSAWVGAQYGYGFRHTPGGFGNRTLGGRGIQYDNSFHHRVDGVNNTLSYGRGYAAAFAEWAVYTAGTDYAFSDDKLERLIDYYLDGICKTAAFGQYPDAGAKNRSVSRPGALRPYGATLPEQLMHASRYRIDELQEIADIRKHSLRPARTHATYFWHSEHFSCQRPDWFASVRLYSTRTHNMEQPYNREGLLNHHRGDGANHLARTGDEYLDLWPVYDYQKIPGATILQKPALPGPGAIQQLGLTDFVGAATDGHYGTVGFDFRSPHDPLVARKAWFFFDDEYVCLGAGISCKNRALPVATTLNQCHLRGEVLLASAGEISTLKNEERRYEAVDWIYHDSVGYVFPNPTSVHLQNNAAAGSWWRINQQSDTPKEAVHLDVFKLWLDHGKRPSDATYAYTVVPATSRTQLQQWTADPPLTVLRNTPEVQAVYHHQLQLAQAVFYQAGTLQLTDKLQLTCATPGIVLLQQRPDGTLRLTVADPNRELSAMQLSLSTKIERTEKGVQVFWNAAEKTSTILIELPGGQYAGSSVSIDL